MTLLTIPEFDTPLSRILQRNDVSIALDVVLSMLDDVENFDTPSFIEKISKGLQNNVSTEVFQIITNEIATNGVQKFLTYYRRLNAQGQSFMDLMYEEFKSLLSAPGISTDNFSMSHPKVIVPDSDFIPELRVHPVNKIRTITVQAGYSRLVNLNENEEPGRISSGTYLDGNIWYPGYEGFGEGIFVTFKDGIIPDISTKLAYNDWKKYGDSGTEQKNHWSEVTHKPEFVWLHTLSHAIIRSLSAYTGYSTTSMRERVYISRDGTNGGILIYNTSPGEDSGMGGLAGTAAIFKEIIGNAIDNLVICSNDPLCNDMKKSSDSINGAACYSCLLISETSCEHRNLWLDRHLIVGDTV
jgi:hypothetical protein